MDPRIAVECRNLTKSYGVGPSRTVALRGIDLTIRRGELLMLVGPSGCGKTTLISIIAGILSQDSGSCWVLGEEINSLSNGARTAFRGKQLGFVFQAFNLIPALTAAENVAVPLLISGIPRKEAVERANGMLARVGLGDRGRSLPAELSGGQQQRVAIARSLISSPHLIVCDEPTSALDEANGHQVMELFREIALAEDRVLLIVTHDTRIFSFADRIAQMNDGHIVEIHDQSKKGF